MDRSDDRTPYRPHGARGNRRRLILIVGGLVLAVAVGLTLHVLGVLPPD